MRTITFYSYKGGVGRTLALANVARYLALLNQKVVVLDLDLEAPGIHYKLQPNTPILGGIVDLVSEFLRTRVVPDPSKFLVPVSNTSSHDDFRGAISLLAAGVADGGSYWSQLAAIDWQSFLSGGANANSADAALGAAFFLETREKIRTATSADFLIIDARTGVTQIGGVATSLLADDVVCLFAHNDESLDATSAILKSISAVPRLPNQSPVRLFPVLSRIPELSEETEGLLLKGLSERLAIATLPNAEPVSIMHSLPELQLTERVLLGATEIGGDESEEITGTFSTSQLFYDYLRLFQKLLVPEQIDAHLQQLIAQQKMRSFSDPASAGTALERLARRYPHEHSYRALLQFYRLTNALGLDKLQKARRLLDLTGNYGEPLLHEVVRDNLEFIDATDDEQQDLLSFAERVWRARRPMDYHLGLTLARLFRSAGLPESSVQVLVDLVELGSLDDPATTATIIDELCESGAWHVAVEVASSRPQVNRTPLVQRAWARGIVGTGERARAEEWLSSADYLEEAVRGDAATWEQLQVLAGRKHPAIENLQAEALHVYQEARRTGITTAHAERLVALDAALRTAGDTSNVVPARVVRLIPLAKTPAQMRIVKMLQDSLIQARG